MTKEFLCHNDALSHFNTLLFKNVFTHENIKSTKKVINLKLNNDEGKKQLVSHYGYYLEKKGKRYFLPDSVDDNNNVIDSTNMMPIKVIDTEEVDYKGEVFEFIESLESTKIPSKKVLTFRELIDSLCAFNHTNDMHWLLYRIVTVVAAIDRINFRVVSEAGFGKDSTVNAIMELVNSTSNIYGATFAKMEYHLRNKFLFFNEIGNLKADDKYNFQQFFLATGAYSNQYSKKSRKTEATLEDYNIAKTSIGIAYNTPDYYISKGQDYFETLFTSAVVNRFIPFLFEGRLTTDFSQLIDFDELVKEYMGIYKGIVSTLTYYRLNKLSTFEYELPLGVGFTVNQKRYERTFLTVCKYLAEYATDEGEFQELAKELFTCYTNYVERYGKNDKENE